MQIRDHHVSSEPAALARRLIGTSCSSAEVAACASRAALQLSQHLSRLVGDTGIKSIAHRSMMVASSTFPWLASEGRTATSDPCAAMRNAMAAQKAEVATEAFILVWTTFIGLLGKLIGKGLVEGLLDEIWPTEAVPLLEEMA